jgi:hypothetical protein
MKNLKLIQELENAIEELDDNKVSWINKHLVIDLHDKAVVLLHSLNTLENADETIAVKGATLFLKEVTPVIDKMNEEEK